MRERERERERERCSSQRGQHVGLYMCRRWMVLFVRRLPVTGARKELVFLN